MTLDNIKKISIREYLGRMGANPTKENSWYGMYHSPFREDKDASMKVDYNQNLWIDYGSGEGGSIIDLVARLENISIAEAIAKLDDNSFSFQRNISIASIAPASRESAIKIQHIVPLTHPALLDYLKERNINADITKRYCSEVHYSIAGKNYFAIGFRNDAEGWELRNRNFKGSISPKNITTYNNANDTVMVFEGFMDFLSYLSLKDNPSPTIDTAILNSTANLSKAIPFLKSYRTVHGFLDNDDAGRKSLANLRELLTSSEVVDHSGFYRNYKDLNEYWQEKSKPKNRLVGNHAAVQIKRQIPVKKKGRGL